MLHVFPISNRVTDQVIMINSVITIFINNIIISITIIFAIFIPDEEDEERLKDNLGGLYAHLGT